MIHSTITGIERVSPTTVSIRFPWESAVLPGQFIMVWIPGLGEIPISLSHTGELKGITIKSFGPTSEALTKMKEGDRIFFRGPYGRPFTQVKGKILVVGGGSGMAGLLPLINSDTVGVVSARTKDELLFVDRFLEGNVIKVTDDGSAGIKGIAVDGLKGLDLQKFTKMYICGPELMLRSVYRYIREIDVDAEFSLERLMKCGIGVCDSCSIDGYQLCRDGPTFSKKQISGMHEFGAFKLTESGKRIALPK